MARPLILLIRVYQYLISPLLPPMCRFYPSCSRYAVQALQTHGALRGCWLTLLRLLKCHPFHPGGHDPVPGDRNSVSPIRPDSHHHTVPHTH